MIPEWETDLNREAIDKAVDRISSLSLTRNNWIHGVWSRERDTDKTFVFDIRRSELDRAKRVKAHDVENHTKTVLQRTAELRALLPMSYRFTPEETEALDGDVP
jgi:hypothetical protein